MNRDIHVDQTADCVVTVVDGVAVTSADWPTLQAKLDGLDTAQNPLASRLGDQVVLDPSLRPLFLSASRPVDELRRALDEEAEASGWFMNDPSQALFPEITIDGPAWGWMWSGSDGGSSAGYGTWRLVPTSPVETRSIVRGHWEADGPPASSGNYGVEAWDDVVVSWSYVPDFENVWTDISYGEPSRDDVYKLLASEFEPTSSICPFDEPAVDRESGALPGVPDEVQLDASVDPKVLVDAVFEPLYGVCDKHRNALQTVVMGGFEWKYVDAQWKLVR